MHVVYLISVAQTRNILAREVHRHSSAPSPCFLIIKYKYIHRHYIGSSYYILYELLCVCCANTNKSGQNRKRLTFDALFPLASPLAQRFE